ncbi:helix-hairpin-helix domain-containing protein [Shewanella colwelliana]|uniref:Mitomycin resistance protein n=1 Tax=Shewanella colwelliana TaxID=23 RepID=A0A1E5IRL1_SHECO|nr:helix-hairpin-helix domain-containing protein [Shewanella colwelliana]MDX1279712.1 helix-hairpin-helix domain-containing protein [Shewanella colwelliana]OEG72583.1 mitomycin resistance protein [Shewanella colwelliana]GIU45587.1 hypothetical protein TUM3794_36240 [Shewanella colwelliana]
MTARIEITQFQAIPNVGKATEADLRQLGFAEPIELVGQDPYQMYDKLCQITEQQHDPCVIDVFIAAVRFMEGAPAKKWWAYTAERKAHLALQALNSHKNGT